MHDVEADGNDRFDLIDIVLSAVGIATGDTRLEPEVGDAGLTDGGDVAPTAVERPQAHLFDLLLRSVGLQLKAGNEVFVWPVDANGGQSRLEATGRKVHPAVGELVCCGASANLGGDDDARH